MPLFSIFYLFYNKDLLDDYAKKGIDAQRYIDDITIIATGKSVKDNNQKLAKIYNQVYKSWKIKHQSEFNLPKYQFIYISKKKKYQLYNRRKVKKRSFSLRSKYGSKS